MVMLEQYWRVERDGERSALHCTSEVEARREAGKQAGEKPGTPVNVLRVDVWHVGACVCDMPPVEWT